MGTRRKPEGMLKQQAVTRNWNQELLRRFSTEKPTAKKNNEVQSKYWARYSSWLPPDELQSCLSHPAKGEGGMPLKSSLEGIWLHMYLFSCCLIMWKSYESILNSALAKLLSVPSIIPF